MSLTDDHRIDVLTFEETKFKPFALPSEALAFEVFQPRMEALILDAIYNILKQKSDLALRTEDLNDGAYTAKVIAACRRY